MDAGELKADFARVAGALQAGRALPLAAFLGQRCARAQQSVELPAAEWCPQARGQQLSSSGPQVFLDRSMPKDLLDFLGFHGATGYSGLQISLWDRIDEQGSLSARCLPCPLLHLAD